jgi:hypothetical protein
MMNRRGFLAMLGAGAAITAAGLIVPDVARKIFLPPRGGWLSGSYNGALNVGDIVTFEGVYDPLVIRRCKQFVVTSIDDSGAEIFFDPHETVRYDAAWTLPSGEQEQFHLDSKLWDDAHLPACEQDDFARRTLEGIMRRRGGTPGAARFKLELPRNNILDARYI